MEKSHNQHKHPAKNVTDLSSLTIVDFPLICHVNDDQ